MFSENQMVDFGAWKGGVREGFRGRITKLHGSANWKRGGEGEADKVFIYPGQARNFEDNLLLYPGYKGRPTIWPFRKFYDTLEGACDQASVIIIIGYSFRDEAINEILEASIISDNKHLIDIDLKAAPPEKHAPNNEVLKSDFIGGGFGKSSIIMCKKSISDFFA